MQNYQVSFGKGRSQRMKLCGANVLLCCAGSLVLAMLAYWGISHLSLDNLSFSYSANKAQLQQVSNSYAETPLSFESNQGQASEDVKFLSKGDGYSLFLAPSEVVFALRKPETEAKKDTLIRNSAMAQCYNEDKTNVSIFKMQLVGGNRQAKIVASDLLESKSNYYLGNDPSKWVVNVPHYAKVRYEKVYEGIDLVYYGNQTKLEYDFVVKPGANPEQIRIAFTGGNRISIDATGDLVLQTGSGELRQQRPILYQEENGQRVPVEGRYVTLGQSEFGFAVGDYNKDQTLIIDPVLIYSTYLGGFDNEHGNAIEADAAGNAYVTGITYSVDFPTKFPLQFSLRGVGNAWVAKFDPAGKLLYSTYLGGQGEDSGLGVTADANGNAYVAGATSSSNFPVTSGAVQGNRGGRIDAFVAKISPNGDNLIYATFLGGQADDTAYSIAVDTGGNAYVTGQTNSFNFPVGSAMQGSLKGISDAYLAKLSANGRTLVFATYLGGDGQDAGFGVAVDSTGNPHVTGVTYSNNFPTRNAFQANNGGRVDAFVSKFNSAGSALIFSTYAGGSLDDAGMGIGLDSSGNAYAAGITDSTNFPTKSAVQSQLAGRDDAFALKLDSSGALVYATFLGGSGDDRAFDLAVDANGNAYLGGRTDSANFPVNDAVQPRLGVGAAGQSFGGEPSLASNVIAKFSRDNVELYKSEPDLPAAKYQQSQPSVPTDGFLTKLGPDGKIVYSTYLGGGDEDRVFGVATDGRGNAYATGLTASANFPVKNLVQPTLRGITDAFITKVADAGNTQTTVSAASFVGGTIAADQIVSSFGNGLATGIQAATTLPLPVNLLGTEVRVEDSQGVARIAPLFFVSPNQINFVVPAASAEGSAKITVWNNGAIVSSETIQVTRVSPGVFSANATGQDVMAGVVLRVRPDGSQAFEPVARYDAGLNKFTPVPIEFGNDQIYLVVFGTGLRHRGGLPTVNATLGGVASQVIYAGAQGSLVGLDQVNILAPNSLAGRGEVNFNMSVDGKSTNVLKVSFK